MSDPEITTPTETAPAPEKKRRGWPAGKKRGKRKPTPAIENAGGVVDTTDPETPIIPIVDTGLAFATALCNAITASYNYRAAAIQTPAGQKQLEIENAVNERIGKVLFGIWDRFVPQEPAK